MTRPREHRWDFPYAALDGGVPDDDTGPCDVVVATARDVEPRAIEAALAALLTDVATTPLLARAPLFWSRVRSASAATKDAIARALDAGGIDVRYVASSARPSMALAPALDLDGVAPARARDWRARRDDAGDDPARGETSGGLWFLADRGGGIAVERSVCGAGAGTRLAVIDDDAAEVGQLGLDALIPVGLARVSEATSHGALMVAWAVGCAGGRGFRGVAPACSPRLYCIPKPGTDLVSLPLAIVRAALDGADVIVCATYVEGSTSPMMDDALAIATRLGRRGRGAAVVIPTGREASSPPGSLHSSWSLALADLAADPRVFCIGPSAREGAWFLWRDRRGRLRPFANRGPAVRWLAPGDDIAYPFGDHERLFHAESSGASAIAAGVILLVLAQNPALRLPELEALLTRTADGLAVETEADARREPLADPADLLPWARDADGHNAKHGYGRLHARRACLAASDPIALELLAMGEEDAASALGASPVRPPWSRRLARWAVRALLADPSAEHQLRALLRHARLIAGKPARQRAHRDGGLARHVTLLLRALGDGRVRRSRAVANELDALLPCLADPDVARAVEAAIHAAASSLWPSDAGALESGHGTPGAHFGSDRVRL